MPASSADPREFSAADLLTLGAAQWLLHEQTKGRIVNDLAEVNIDKALVSTKASGGYGSVAEDDLVELKNGCACCTVSDELMTSIDNLMRHAQTRDSYWDHIVIEATGVAEPREIRDNFAVAVEKTEYVLHTLVTVIDSSTFLKEFEKRNKVQQRPDLGSDEYAELSSRQVVDLMCEQVEVADVSHTHTHTCCFFPFGTLPVLFG